MRTVQVVDDDYRYHCLHCFIRLGSDCVWQALVQHVFWSVAGVQLPKQFPTKTFKEVAISPPSPDPKPYP